MAFFTSTVSAIEMTGKGIKAGLNMATIAGDDVPDDAEMKLGFAVGAYVAFALTNQITLQPEIFFSQKGFALDGKIGGTKFETSTVLNYIEIPILFMFMVQENINVACS